MRLQLLAGVAFVLLLLGALLVKNAAASAVLNAYLDADGSSGNLLGLAALPLFLSMRAAVRAKVELLRAALAAPGRADAVREEAPADLVGSHRMPSAGMSGSRPAVWPGS